MLDVLCPLITEADFISNELLDIILVTFSTIFFLMFEYFC